MPFNPQSDYWWQILLNKLNMWNYQDSGHLPWAEVPASCCVYCCPWLCVCMLITEYSGKVRFSCDSFGFLHTPACADQPLWQLASSTSTAQLSLPLPRLSRLSAPSCSQISVGPSDAMQEMLLKVPNRSLCSGNTPHEANLAAAADLSCLRSIQGRMFEWIVVFMTHFLL